MPTNIHAFAQFLRTRFLENLQMDLTDAGYQIAFHEGTARTKSAIGIHLLAPTEREIVQAAQDAERDGFSAIYIYPA